MQRTRTQRYDAVMRRITPQKIAAAITRTDKEGNSFKLTDLNAVKMVLGIRESDSRHDDAILKAIR